MSKPGKLTKFLYILIAFIFFLQGLGVVNIVPVKPVANFLGLNNDPMHIIVTGFYVVIFAIAAMALNEVFYSVGFKRDGGVINKKRILAQAFIAFLVVMVTIFSYTILSILGIVPMAFVPEQFLSFYLCWYILIDAPLIFPFLKKKADKNVVANEIDVLVDTRRVTWWSHITRLNTSDEFMGEKGEIIFKQGKESNILFFVVFLIMAAASFPVIYLTGITFFVGVTAESAMLVTFVKILVAFSFFWILIALTMVLGIVFSKGIIVYRNCISLPLATLSDKPLFTLLLPKSSVLLRLRDIASYRIERNEKTHEVHPPTISFIMKNGNYYVIDPSFWHTSEQTLINALVPEKISILGNSN